MRSRRERWPPPPAISSRGTWAGVTTGSCLIVVGVAFVVFSFDELTCRLAEGGCDVFIGVGGIISMLALAVVALGAIVLRSVLVRPRSATGASGWVWGWGALSAAGGLVAVTRIPTNACPEGFRLDAPFALCLRGGHRVDPTSLLIEKGLLAIAAVALGVLLARARWIPSGVASAITVVAWVGGMGLLLVDTVAREFLPA